MSYVSFFQVLKEIKSDSQQAENPADVVVSKKKVWHKDGKPKTSQHGEKFIDIKRKNEEDESSANDLQNYFP